LTSTRFLLFFSIFALALGLAFYFLEYFTASLILVPKFWVIFGFLALITIIAYITSLIGIKKGGEVSSYAILGGIILKLLFSMVFVLLYLLKIRVNKMNFVLEFFSLYFLFTAFEVYCLLRNLRLQNKT
jgi:choline-glycine betaine transporter